MVGVPTRNRCDNCRRRKKKCNEQKPSCSECIRSGWHCPGYATRWKFVDETSRLAEHYAGRKYIFDDIANLEVQYPSYPGMQFHSLQAPYGESLQICERSVVPRYLETNPLGSVLVYCLESKVKDPLIPLRLIGAFFDFVPAHLGRNPALDAAVSCLCSIYCDTSLASQGSHRSMYQGYVRALSSLRYCLSDVALRMESETLCASILLHMCELVVSVDRGGWSELARGTAFLLYSRGVDRYKSAFDHSMLESQLGFVLAQAVGFKEHCFLRSQEWQTLLLQGPVWPYQTLQARSLSLRSRLCAILADLPSLIIYNSTLDEDQTCQTIRSQKLDFLIYKASTTLNAVSKWVTVEANPQFLSYVSSGQVIQGPVKYPDIIAGVSDCVAHTALVTIDKVLHSLWKKVLQPDCPEGQQKQLIATPDIIERWRHRAITSFNFVQKESVLAAKPLDFGLRQIQSSDTTAQNQELNM